MLDITDTLIGIATGIVGLVVASLGFWRWGWPRLEVWLRSKLCQMTALDATILEQRLRREREMTDVCVLIRPLDEPITFQNSSGRVETHETEKMATVRCIFPHVGGIEGDNATVVLPVAAVVEPGWTIQSSAGRCRVDAVTTPGPHDLDRLAGGYVVLER